MSSARAAAWFGLRSARHRLGRITATALAVSAATALAVAAFGMAAQTDELLGGTSSAVEAIDLLPEGSVVITAGTPGATEPTAISTDLVEAAAGVDGVLDASGTYEQPIAVRIPRGSQDDRPPMLRGLVFSSEWNPERWVVRRGVDPAVATPFPPSDEQPVAVALDAAGLATARASIGDVVRLQTPTGGRDARIVGEVAAAASADVDGATAGRAAPAGANGVADAHVVVERDTLTALLGAQGRVDRITVTPQPGVGTEQLTRDLAAALPDDLVLRSAADPEVALARSVVAASDAITLGTTALAVLAALVAASLITNTLSIVAAQRSVEVALARCIGMSRRQVIGSFLVEAVLIGVVAAVLGLAAGAPLAVLGAGIVFPDTSTSLVVTPAMAVVAVLVGLVVTVLSATRPARRLARVPPVAALSATRARRGRSVLLSAVLPLINLLRRAARGPVLRMSLAQPAQDPRRSGAVVATLFVSLVLVSTVLTVSTSVRSSIDAQYADRSTADLYLRRRGVVRVDARSLEARLGAEDRAGYVDLSRVEGTLVGPDGVEPVLRAAALDEVPAAFPLDLDTTPSSDLAGAVLLSEPSAAELGVGAGDEVTLRSTSGVDTALTVRGIYRNAAVVGPALVSVDAARSIDAEGSFELAAIRLEPGDPVERVRRAIDRNIGGFNRLAVDTPQGFAATDTEIAATVTRLVLVILAGTLALGAVGAANNIALSVHERRRELATLRAVGARRRQVAAMVTTEAVTLCAMVGVVAAALGTAMAVVVLRLAPAELASAARVPVPALVAVVAAAMALGAAAAAVPAISAARRPPLEGLGDA
jgi:putative ABC transport system permease protein